RVFDALWRGEGRGGGDFGSWGGPPSRRASRVGPSPPAGGGGGPGPGGGATPPAPLQPPWRRPPDGAARVGRAGGRSWRAAGAEGGGGKDGRGGVSLGGQCQYGWGCCSPRRSCRRR